jgi:hypothetical protein
MTGIKMRKDRAGQRQNNPRQPGGPRVQSAANHPPFHAPAENDEMKEERKIKRRGQRQKEEQKVGWIKHRRLESAEERHAPIGVRIPKRQVARHQRVREKGARGHELADEIGRTRERRRAVPMSAATTLVEIRSCRW